MRRVTALHLDPDLAVLDRLRPALRRALSLRSGDPMPEPASELELATHEVLVNVIEHGRPDDAIEVRIHRAGVQLAVEILDRGNPYDRRDVREPAPGALVEGGWGIPLARRLTDRFTYVREEGRNRWRLEKEHVR